MRNDRDIEGQLHAVRDDVASLRDDVHELIRALRGSVEDETDGLLGRMADAARDNIDQAATRLRQTETDVTKAVASQPLVCLIVAFVAGVLLGRMLNR